MTPGPIAEPPAKYADISNLSCNLNTGDLNILTGLSLSPSYKCCPKPIPIDQLPSNELNIVVLIGLNLNIGSSR